MADSISIVIHRSRMIDYDRWVSELDKACFSIVFDGPIDMWGHSGTVPCRYKKKKTYFGYSITEASELDIEHAQSMGVGNSDIVVDLEIRGGMTALKAATAAASVLAETCDGFIIDDEKTIEGIHAVAWAKEWIEDTEKREERDADGKRIAKKLAKNQEQAWQYLMTEVVQLVGKSASDVTCFMGSIYLTFRNDSGYQILRLKGWHLIDRSKQYPDARAVRSALLSGEEARADVERELSPIFESKITDLSKADGNVLTIVFENGERVVVDPSGEFGNPGSSWDLKVTAGFEFWVWHPETVQVFSH